MVQDTTLTINGSTRTIAENSNFRETAITAARDAGLGKFRVILDGREIDPADAPETLSPGMNLEIKPYEEAGSVNVNTATSSEYWAVSLASVNFN